MYNKGSQVIISIIYTTSTKNASLIITDFLAMIYKKEQPRTAPYVKTGRCWKMTLI